MEKLNRGDIGDTGDATSGSKTDASMGLKRSNEEGNSNMDRPEEMSPASHPVLRNGGVGTPVVDLTSGDDGSDKDAIPRTRGDNVRGQSNEGAATSSRESLPNTPKVNRNSRRMDHPVDLTPNFRFAAAMAGWDDEALLLAALGLDTPVEVLKQATGKGTSEDLSKASCSDRCGGCNLCRERKRVTRTPGQAATPLSAARRHRRLRRNSSNEGCMHPIPMAGLNDEGGNTQGPLKNFGDSQQHVSAGDDKKILESSLKTTSPPVAEKGIILKNEEIQLEKLREELTCVVCLEVCFEPSTTSCGHSFCRSCLQSVFQKCGMRCPKCREQLRTNSSNGCPINTVLWNTIQLLFPKETAARTEDRRKSSENVKVDSTKKPILVIGEERQPRLRNSGLMRRTTRATPWRQLPGVSAQERSRPLRRASSFQRASLLTSLEASQQPGGDQNERVAVSAGGTARTRRAVSTQNRSPQTLRQEQEDAALAAWLQDSYISEAGI